MLNQFYDYMAKKLIDFLKKEPVQPGQRYYLQFDQVENVIDFYHVLKSLPEASPFTYQHEKGSPYNTFSINVGDVKIIIAATIDGVTPDFLVTIRNQVSDQKGDWKNTALISLSHLSLDSIQGGSKNLQSKGMPFNIRQVSHYIKDELKEENRFSLAEKEIIHFHLDKKLEDMVVQTTIWDYADVIALFQKGSIEEQDFKNLHLFPDPELNKDTYIKSSDIQARLKENSHLFELVQRIHDYETLDTELEKYFDEKMISKLKRDDWYNQDLILVKESYDRSKSEQLIYYDSHTKKLNKGLDYWEKAQSQTKAGQRKRHIIIFDNMGQTEVEMFFEFDDQIKKQYIHKKSEPYCEAKGKKLKVTLPTGEDNIHFYQVKYKHKNESKSTYEFNFCIVPFGSDELKGIETQYEIKVKDSDSVIFLNYTGEQISIGDGAEREHTIQEAYETITKDSETKLILDTDAGAWDDDRLIFRIAIGQTYLPVELKDTDVRSTPIDAKRVIKLKREKSEHFVMENNKLRQGTAIYYPYEDFKDKLILEQSWVEQGQTFVKNGVQKENFNLPDEVMGAYRSYLAYFKDYNRLPSLSYMDEELLGLAQEYIRTVTKYIQAIEEDTLLSDTQQNVFRLGMYIDNERIWLTPLHPLNVAYQLSLTTELKDEDLDYVILSRLHPNNLLPFIYSEEDELYRPSLNTRYAEWHEYEPERLISVGSANEFMAKVVEEKISQFVSHFDYLFLSSARSPLLLNVVDINNDKEIVRGIFNFLKAKLESVGPEGMIPVEVSLYRDRGIQSAFELFSSIQTPSELEMQFNINLQSKDFDPVDVLRVIRENIHYYQKDFSLDRGFVYSHISFFKLPTQDMDVSHPTNLLESGISLNGLISSVVAISSESDYRSGFGLLNAPENPNDLIKMATCYNELAFNLKNEGRNSYSKNKSIVMSTSTHNQELLNGLYDSSVWVTFIDPGVDLDFFQASSNDLLVIHYNDQHTSSDRYDAITVTSKADQYKSAIKDYMKENSYSITDTNINQAIKAFNSINGEWLLRIIGSKGHFAREKISIISAMKYLESYLYHPHILWIPISLEEILRVAAVVNLTKQDGIFSTKILKSFGKHSDDILMMGIEEIDNQLFVYFYPVEVKIGSLQSAKANIQIEKTSELFKEYLIDKREESSFRKKFYRNFFAQIVLSNAKKIHSNGLWSDEKYEKLHSLKNKLLNDDFIISEHLERYIGKGAVLHFRNNNGFRSANLINEIMNLTFIEEDAYVGLSVSTEETIEKMKSGYLDMIPENLLSNLYKPEDVEIANVRSEKEESLNEKRIVTDDKPSVEEEEENVESEDVESHTDVSLDGPLSNNDEERSVAVETLYSHSDIRIPFGRIEGSNQVVHWEFDNRNLANRHLFISGGSGQGKTYFIQCLLWELAKNDISSIIIDYTDGFKKSQLEQDFKEKLGNRLEQFIVLTEKFPINPFKRNQKELDEDLFVKEDDSDVAERMKNVIGSIYSTLGPQQLNCIYQAVMKGMSLYDEKMNFDILRGLLEEDGSGPAKTALSQMNLLIDKNPFDSSKNMDWSFLEKEKGKVFIIQLTGYSPDVQKLITEFILWDLWYYKLQHGNKKIPFPAVLDEAQRLDFSINSPSAKILTEGRKFGWSGWFATQSMKGFSPDQVSRLQNSAVKVYFAPVENEIATIASNIAADSKERKEWENKLAGLHKGQCIIYAPVLDRHGNLMPSSPYVVNILPFSER